MFLVIFYQPLNRISCCDKQRDIPVLCKGKKSNISSLRVNE